MDETLKRRGESEMRKGLWTDVGSLEGKREWGNKREV